MTTLSPTKCCGMLEIDNLAHSKTPEEALIALKTGLEEGYTDHRYGTHHYPVPFVIFTTVTKRKVGDHSSRRLDDYGQAFASFIQEHNLGKIFSSEERKNWTANTLKVWIWQPDYENLRAYFEAVN